MSRVLRSSFFFFLRCLAKVDGGSRTEDEEKVYSWLYKFAQSQRDLVFEYVRSTERGEYNLCYLGSILKKQSCSYKIKIINIEINMNLNVNINKNDNLSSYKFEIKLIELSNYSKKYL